MHAEEAPATKWQNLLSGVQPGLPASTRQQVPEGQHLDLSPSFAIYSGCDPARVYLTYLSVGVLRCKTGLTNTTNLIDKCI